MIKFLPEEIFPEVITRSKKWVKSDAGKFCFWGEGQGTKALPELAFGQFL
jgi:hypothetical protein